MVNTKTLTWELIGTVTWVYTNNYTWELNRYGRPDQTGSDQTPFKSFNTLESEIFYTPYIPRYVKKLCSDVRNLPVAFHIGTSTTTYQGKDCREGRESFEAVLLL